MEVVGGGGGGGERREPQLGEVTFLSTESIICSPHLSRKSDQSKMRDYLERLVTPPKGVTAPNWGPHLRVNRP